MKKNTIINVLLFTAGAAVGSAVTWYVVKTKYERIAQEEIDSVKETWARMMREEALNDTSVEDEFIDDDEDDEMDSDEDDFTSAERIDYSRLASMYNKSGDDDDTENDGEGEGDSTDDVEVPSIDGPYVITPDEFADGNFDHSLYCLTYYSDGVLANDWWEEIDIDDTIGRDALDHFGDYAEDIVHVRNKRLEADYEVAQDPRRYADLIANDPLLKHYDA
jgi:hypothetical protein